MPAANVKRTRFGIASIANARLPRRARSLSQFSRFAFARLLRRRRDGPIHGSRRGIARSPSPDPRVLLSRSWGRVFGRPSLTSGCPVGRAAGQSRSRRLDSCVGVIAAAKSTRPSLASARFTRRRLSTEGCPSAELRRRWLRDRRSHAERLELLRLVRAGGGAELSRCERRLHAVVGRSAARVAASEIGSWRCECELRTTKRSSGNRRSSSGSGERASRHNAGGAAAVRPSRDDEQWEVVVRMSTGHVEFSLPVGRQGRSLGVGIRAGHISLTAASRRTVCRSPAGCASDSNSKCSAKRPADGDLAASAGAAQRGNGGSGTRPPSQPSPRTVERPVGGAGVWQLGLVAERDDVLG